MLKGLKITSIPSRRPRPRPTYLTVTTFINQKLYTRNKHVQTSTTVSESKISFKKMSYIRSLTGTNIKQISHDTSWYMYNTFVSNPCRNITRANCVYFLMADDIKPHMDADTVYVQGIFNKGTTPMNGNTNLPLQFQCVYRYLLRPSSLEHSQLTNDFFVSKEESSISFFLESQRERNSRLIRKLRES